jgi:hypothetical protein
LSGWSVDSSRSQQRSNAPCHLLAKAHVRAPNLRSACRRVRSARGAPSLLHAHFAAIGARKKAMKSITERYVINLMK